MLEKLKLAICEKKEEHFMAEKKKNKTEGTFFLLFFGPPAFDSSTSSHACWLPVHPSLVPMKSKSRVKSQEIS